MKDQHGPWGVCRVDEYASVERTVHCCEETQRTRAGVCAEWMDMRRSKERFTAVKERRERESERRRDRERQSGELTLAILSLSKISKRCLLGRRQGHAAIHDCCNNQAEHRSFRCPVVSFFGVSCSGLFFFRIPLEI